MFDSDQGDPRQPHPGCRRIDRREIEKVLAYVDSHDRASALAHYAHGGDEGTGGKVGSAGAAGVVASAGGVPGVTDAGGIAMVSEE
jgi:hypothetical protein